MRPGIQAILANTDVVDATESSVTVVALRSPRRATRQRHPRELLERVYTAGSLAVAPDDLATKIAVAGLAAFGFLVVQEVQADGTTRRLVPGAALPGSDPPRPWRIAKSAFSGTAIGVPDAVGAIIRDADDGA